MGNSKKLQRENIALRLEDKDYFTSVDMGGKERYEWEKMGYLRIWRCEY